MKLSNIREVLTQIEVNPSKTLGQNFLHDQNLARWLVAHLEAKEGEHLVEIGPGLGALTALALQTGASLTAIEKDGRLVSHLKSRFAAEIESGQLEVIHGDATEFEAKSLWLKQPIKVFGNLPYYVSTPLLFHFTSPSIPVARTLLFVLQKELALRLAAIPRTKDYGIISVILQRRWKIEYLRTLPSNVFTPVPKVDSGAVMLVPRKEGELPFCDNVMFERLVRIGFSQRRKQLKKLLNATLKELGERFGFTPWEELTSQLGLLPTARAEELSVEEWIAFTNLVAPVSPANAQLVHDETFDVVDDNDHPIRKATRSEVHAQDLKHRAVHVFGLNKKGDALFLQRRSAFKDRHPNVWDASVTGHLNAGEDYESAARRELTEELGLTTQAAAEAQLELVDTLPATAETGWEFIRIYSTHLRGNHFRWPAAEIEWGDYFPIELVDQWVAQRPQDFAPGFRQTFLACRKFWKR